MKKVLIILLLLCSLIVTPLWASEKPKIAVYVTGDWNENDKRAVDAWILKELLDSDRYVLVERSQEFVAKVKEELNTQHNGDIGDNEMCMLGRGFGVQFVCVVSIKWAVDAYQISARIIDVETREVKSIGISKSNMKSTDEMERVSKEVVQEMFKEIDPNDEAKERRNAKIKQEKHEKQKALFGDTAKFWSVGASAGFSITKVDPKVSGTIHGTIAPYKNWFLEIGCDVGFCSFEKHISCYYSIIPFVHCAYFKSFDDFPIPFVKGGYIGAGGSVIVREKYCFDNIDITQENDAPIPAADFITIGLNIINFFDVSYTFSSLFIVDRNLVNLKHKVSIGFIYRIK